MYLVVSVYEAKEGQDDEFIRRGQKVSEALRQQPGMLLLEVFPSEGKWVAVHGYRDEAAYHALVSDPDGPFARALAENRVEDVGNWLYSMRGAALPSA